MVAAPHNLAAIASVLMAVCDGLMLQWKADPQTTLECRRNARRLDGAGCARIGATKGLYPGNSSNTLNR